MTIPTWRAPCAGDTLVPAGRPRTPTGGVGCWLAACSGHKTVPPVDADAPVVEHPGTPHPEHR